MNFFLRNDFFLFIIAIIALLGLYGWAAGQTVLSSYSELFIPMAPATSLLFLLLSISAFSFNNPHLTNRATYTAIFFPAISLAFCVFILLDLALSLGWDLESIFIKEPEPFTHVSSGRMSPITLALFIIVSISLICQAKKRSKRIADLCGFLNLAVFFISFILVTGYLYNAPLLYGSNYIPVALPTAICFLFLSFSMMRMSGLLFELLHRNTTQYLLAKSFLPVVIVFIFIHGLLNSNIFLHIENPTLISALLLLTAIPLSIFIIHRTSSTVVGKLKKAEEAIRHSEEQFRALFMTMNQGFYISEVLYDDGHNPVDYRYLEVNPGFEKILGLARDQVIGKRYREIVPSDATGWLENYLQVARTGVSRKFEFYSKEYEKYFETYSYKSSKSQVTVIAIDITERKLVEIELLRKGALLNVTGSTAKVGGWELDVDTKKQVWTEEMYRIYEVGFNFDANLDGATNFYAPSSRPLIENAIKRAIEFGEPFDLILEFITAKGNQRWVQSIGKVYKENGKTKKLFGSFQDITERKLAEEELVKNEALMRTAIDNLPLIFYVIDPQGIFQLSIGAGLKSLGLQPNQVVGQSAYNIYKDFPEITDFIKLSLSGKTVNFESNVSGAVHTNYVTPIPASDGNLTGIVGVALDITELKKAGLALKQSEEKFSKAFLTSPDSININRLNDGLYIDVNDGFSRITGYSKEEVIGKTSKDIDIWADPRQRSLLVTGLSTHGAVNNLEARFKMKDGRVIDGLMSAAVINLNNKPHIISITRDISELKRSQIRVENERIRLRTLVETIPDLVWLKDPDGKYLICNQEFEKLYGAKESEIISKTDYDYVDKGQAEFFRQKDIEALKANKPTKNFERLKYANDGHEALMETIKTPLYDAEGNLIGIMGIARDVTRLHDLNENLEKLVDERTQQLEAANKGLESFAYSISHDLRAPLRHIDGFSRLLMESVAVNDTSETERFYQKINGSITSMLSMIEALLQFSRLGRKPVIKANVNLDELIRKIVGQQSASQKTEWVIGELPVVQGDWNLLSLAFENLISNAVKFTSKNPAPKIEIGVSEKKGQKPTIFIKDNGVGFDMAYSYKLFNVFQRLHTLEEFDGTGIGLANVKQIIQKHGGAIWAEGVPGNGATFYLTI